MTQVVTFLQVTPIARYDTIAWTQARIEESATADGTYAAIETINLSPVDADPTNPATRNLTTEDATGPDLWYRIVFVDGTGDESAPTDPIQNISSGGTSYSTVNELARILKIRVPSAEQTDAMARVLATAAGEIDSEIDRADTDDALAGWQLSLVEEVNLERAVEHWNQMETPFGVLGVGADLMPIRMSRDSWDRHALKLAPIKTQWGLA